MSLWEYIGNSQKYLNGIGGNNNTPNVKNNRLPFGVTVDVAKNLPDNPGGWNDAVEAARLKALEGAGSVLGKPQGILAGAAVGTVIPGVGTGIGALFGATAYGIAEADKASKGKVSKALMAGAKNVRSNYAFTRDVAEKDTGMGLLAGLTMIAGGVLGGVAGFAVGGPIGAVAGAGLGAGFAGKAQRDVAESGMLNFIDKELQKSAKFSESDAGQEHYNFGRDTTQFAAKITGWNTLGDTTKGIGAITSGILNFGLEANVGPDVLGLKFAGATARSALVNPIVQQQGGISARIFKGVSPDMVRDRLVADVDLIKRTVAGEVTPYTPVFKFYRENDAATIIQRPEFRNEVGQIGAQLIAGQTDETIGLILRVGRGDIGALQELAVKRADKWAELNRYQSALQSVDNGYSVYFDFKDDMLLLSKTHKDKREAVEAEVSALRKEVSFVNDVLKLDSRMADRTVSKFAWAERLRNDFAKERAARKLEGAELAGRETAVGNIVQGFYQKNPLSVPIRFIERMTDEAPRGTVNFNEPIMAVERVRVGVRDAVKNKLIFPEETLTFMDDFINARTEVDKFNFIESYNDTITQRAAAKHGVSPLIADEVVKIYRENNRKVVSQAKVSNELDNAYFIDEAGEIISDPVLVTQLANGSYIIDAAEVDKAFARYAKKMGAEAGLPMNAALGAKFIADEFNGLWRGFTLARAGYPINIIRDSALRAWGDLSLFGVFKELGIEAMDSISRNTNTVPKINDWIQGVGNPKKNISNIRKNIDERVTTIQLLESSLKDAKYDFANPPKTISDAVQRTLEQHKNLKATVDELRRQESALLSGVKSKPVGRDKITVSGYDFPAPFSGRFGAISRAQLTQKDDLRRALASSKELEIENIRRGRTGSIPIVAAQDEAKHLQAWEQILNDKIRFDDVARQILAGKKKSDVVLWLKDPANITYIERFGKELGANTVYERVKTVVDTWAPNPELRKLILEDKLNLVELKKLYPDVHQRPIVLTDAVDDMLANSNAYGVFRDKLKDAVAWLSTAPTSRLMYNPYFALKYQQKLQNQVTLANVQGRRLTDADKALFEKSAREFAIGEYRTKLNSFHKDMNYAGIINYVLAFFPALIEQYRAYGKIALENPDFIAKAAQVTTLPGRIGQVETDAFGTEYLLVDMPFTETEGRVPTSWFNPLNPTGGSIISAGPLATFSVNSVANKYSIENRFTDFFLPFGAQANALQPLTPNTLKRSAQAFQATLFRSGEQFNKDANVILLQKRYEFADQKGRQPNASELKELSDQAEDGALSFSILRWASSFLLPTQPRYVTPLTFYADELNKMRNADPINGEEEFIQKYPDFFLLTTRLSDATSGIIPDKTAVTLAKNNPDVIKNIVAAIGEDNLNVLGAVFNDSNYAFSSSAQAWLQRSNIPGTREKFREVGASLDASRSSVVNKGWDDWYKMISIVTDELTANGMNVTKGFGKTILDNYKADFIEAQKTQNNLWYEEKQNNAFGGSKSKQADAVRALTIALNDEKLGKDLLKQPRFSTIVEYLNLRYDVYDGLKAMGTTIDSKKATNLRTDVAEIVETMKQKDVNFAKFYERYFSDDKFDYVYEESK
jgi:hypothetical protein